MGRPRKIGAASGVLALILLVAAVAVATRQRGPGGTVGLVAAGPLVEEPAPPDDPFLSPGDPATSSTTAAPGLVAGPVAPAETITTAPNPPPSTTPPTTTLPPPVPLPADPNAIVLRVSRHGGYPMPGAEQRSQPLELQAGGRLVRPAPVPLDGPGSAHSVLHAFLVPVTEVRALVAAAEAGGATSPPADLGQDRRMADWGVQIFEVDRPGLRSRLVVPDLHTGSPDAPNLTPEQQARRRTLLGVVERLQTAGSFVAPVKAYVRAVATVPRPPTGPTTTVAPETRTWPGPPLAVGLSRCVVLPVAEMDRYVPGWPTASWRTRWRSGEQDLHIVFADATTPGEGCTPPPG